MTIRELIAHLKKYSPEMRVLVPGYEGGYNDVQFFNERKIALNVHTQDYMGAHDDVEGLGDGEVALVVSGENGNAD